MSLEDHWESSALMKQHDADLKRLNFPQVAFVSEQLPLRVDKYPPGFGIEGDFKSTPLCAGVQH